MQSVEGVYLIESMRLIGSVNSNRLTPAVPTG
jgi:hypothetical protein